MRDLHAEFVKYGKNAKYWMRRCAMMLPEINRRRIWRKKGFGSIYEYAAKLAGMNHEKVNECLRIMKHIEDKPELLEVAREKGLGAVRPVATIATKETAKLWAGKIEVMSKHTLTTYVRDYKNGRPGTADEQEVTVKLRAKLAKRFEEFKKRADFEKLLEKFMDEVDAEPKPEPVKTESKHIPTSIKKYVAIKTNGLCAHPGCNKPATEFHHTARFSLRNEHNPDQITPLCKAHHDLAHLGLIANEEKQPYEWQLRTFPDTTNHKYQVDQLVQAYRTG
ncbi:MAG: hypothetical protein UV80_C0005G0019 [Candidatus Peregrinibacteria bacterium GW2011_GWF2_43_17]|nr:MAG: hypothetical protein UV80_C0005G0019 [Candidatus Peregrinibacteria bacterium GW2011_GWF2_43_17]KKT19644.1 MAG: hypothetical protein UW03_C0015G0020 [Candidatus Peregrinibacteria bacterium GW2011_GWA2_43_8]HAU40064.1 hypothetical protein [Candidatus Peregrinibacteria bacterium]